MFPGLLGLGLLFVINFWKYYFKYFFYSFFLFLLLYSHYTSVTFCNCSMVFEDSVIFSFFFLNLLFSLRSFYWYSFRLTELFPQLCLGWQWDIGILHFCCVFLILAFHSDSLLEYLSLYLSISSYLFSTFSSSSLSILITFVLNCWSDSYDTCHPPSCNTVPADKCPVFGIRLSVF